MQCTKNKHPNKVKMCLRRIKGENQKSAPFHFLYFPSSICTSKNYYLNLLREEEDLIMLILLS